jgi:hypothetical protein
MERTSCQLSQHLPDTCCQQCSEPAVYEALGLGSKTCLFRDQQPELVGDPFGIIRQIPDFLGHLEPYNSIFEVSHRFDQ